MKREQTTRDLFSTSHTTQHITHHHHQQHTQHTQQQHTQHTQQTTHTHYALSIEHCTLHDSAEYSTRSPPGRKRTASFKRKTHLSRRSLSFSSGRLAPRGNGAARIFLRGKSSARRNFYNGTNGSKPPYGKHGIGRGGCKGKAKTTFSAKGMF